MEQVKNSFDKETVKKIAKGALIAMSGSAALSLLDYIGTIQIADPAFAIFVSFIVPVLVNAIHQWQKGA